MTLDCDPIMGITILFILHKKLWNVNNFKGYHTAPCRLPTGEKERVFLWCV